MFGRQDSSTQTNNDQPTQDTASQPVVGGASDSTAATAPSTLSSGLTDLLLQTNQSSSDSNSSTTDNSSPSDSATSDSLSTTPALSAPDLPESSSLDSSASPATKPDVSPSGASEDSELLSIKQQALQQIKPLVGHLDQTPEEKFQTTMMMIQGSDDPSLIKDAYEAAQAITDEKGKAQALLDIVNEINYFTHQKAED